MNNSNITYWREKNVEIQKYFKKLSDFWKRNRADSRILERIKMMEGVNTNEDVVEQTETLLDAQWCDSAGATVDSPQLILELKNSLPLCYRQNIEGHCSRGEIGVDNIIHADLQASALSQFMDILNDLDEVLDKSLLACLNDGTKTVEDFLELDDIKETKSSLENIILSETCTDVSRENSTDSCSIQSPSIEVLTCPEEGSTSHTEINESTFERNAPLRSTFTANINLNDNSFVRSHATSSRLGRVQSASDLSDTAVNRNSLLTHRNNVEDNPRLSMRHLEPVTIPTPTEELPIQAESEPLTLPVILFLEHHVNLRPNSAPIQLQVTAANLNATNGSGTGALIVGRRTLLMNRTLSLQATIGHEDRNESNPAGSHHDDWENHSTCNSRQSHNRRSSSSSSSESGESLPNSVPPTPRVSTSSATAYQEPSEDMRQSPFGCWPHRLSSMLACLSCTVGIFNISRFSIFSVHFGANFIIQFFILSLLFGIPLFTLQLCLGQMLASGPMDMWRISPLFQGVGVALLIAQSFMGIYSIIGISWIFIYFRDSFITSEDNYKWSLPFNFYGEDEVTNGNVTHKMWQSMADYWNGAVLQRSATPYAGLSLGTVKFQLAFNLAVVWMIVFVSLSKGLRSYGKAIYVLMFLPICGTLVLCIKLLTLTPHDAVTNIFSDTEWHEFFINSKSWAAAAQETFLTWGILGACVMQLASHNARGKAASVLRRDSACVAAFTLATLLLAALLANTCVQILKYRGYTYFPSSYEDVTSYSFLVPNGEPLPPEIGSTPVRYMTHYASLMGVHVSRPGADVSRQSGYQLLQLATELVPSTLAAVGPHQLSPFWAVIFYFILMMFGIAQQLAIWHCVITGIMAINAARLKAWETTITFCSCVVGLLLGLPMTTDAGISIIHFLDYVVVGSWWHCLLYVVLICGVFVVRGRPYSGDTIVTALYPDTSNRCTLILASLLSFTWNVILPVVMLALCVIDFRLGRQRQLYWWRRSRVPQYWSLWSRQVGVCLQQVAVLAVPVTGFVQTWRYMSSGPTDILERVQNLYRPRLQDSNTATPLPPPLVGHNNTPQPSPAAVPDPPPKYTPPPSYSTATGARLANALRNSVRRSVRGVRRFASSLGETSGTNSAQQRAVTLSENVHMTVTHTAPPHYNALDLQHSIVTDVPSIVVTDETIRIPQRPKSNVEPNTNSLALNRSILRRSLGSRIDNSHHLSNIRSSLRRSLRFNNALTTSNEHLVPRAETISNTVPMSLVGRQPEHTGYRNSGPALGTSVPPNQNIVFDNLQDSL